MSIIDMCKNTLKQFKEAPEYQDYQNEVKETYNKVTMDDFVYHEKLSDLDVGMIMHVSKKSTQREYGIEGNFKFVYTYIMYSDESVS